MESSKQATLFWMSQPGILEDIAQAEADVAAGNTFSEAQIRADFGAPDPNDHHGGR